MENLPSIKNAVRTTTTNIAGDFWMVIIILGKECVYFFYCKNKTGKVTCGHGGLSVRESPIF